MSSTLYLECYSGISGDMTVAALIDLGADRKVLDTALSSLPVQGFETKISRVSKSGVDACDFDVILDEVHENHDHDMEYLHGKGSPNGNEHDHEHRSLSDILHIINQADMTIHSKELAARIFTIIAQAESKAHGVPVEQVHFHEVGAVDSIVDIIAAAVCLDNLEITEVIVPELYEGRGVIRCQHGMLPIPVPAVSYIAADNGLHLHITDTEGELVTPTGAAIAAAIRTSDKLPDQFSILRIGIGAGKREYETPGILRTMIIEEKREEKGMHSGKNGIYKLESNIDDCTGEALGFAMEKLLEAGAGDVHYMPVFMKKNRPAYQINVICSKEDIPKLEQIIFEETTTTGIRRIRMEGTGLKREIQKIHTSLGEVQVKICDLPSGRRIYPEYSSVIEKCKQHQMSYQDVYQTIISQCKSK